MLKKIVKLHNKIKPIKEVYIPVYRVIEINQYDDDYIVKIQVINKSIVFPMKPEEILADDHLVNQFSPKDVRTLTYLGYLGINSPKYYLLAKRLSDQDKTIFALMKKGGKKPILKTAAELMMEKEILNNMPSEDAQLINYTAGSENIIYEKKQKDSLKSKR